MSKGKQDNMIHENNIKLSGTVITQKDIVNLMNIIEKYSSKVTISIEFKDNSKVKKITVRDFSEMNFKNKSIKEMGIHIIDHSKDDFSAWLRYNNFYNLYEFEYEFSNHDKYLNFTNDVKFWVTEVSDRIRYIKFLNSPLIFWLSFVVILIPLFSMMIEHKVDSGYAYLLTFVSMGASALVSFLIKLSFPLTEIDIGNNKHKFARKFLWGIIGILIILTIVLAIVKVNHNVNCANPQHVYVY